MEETDAAPHLYHVQLDKETVTTTRNALLVQFKIKIPKNCLHFNSGLVCGLDSCDGPNFDSGDDCCVPPGKIIVLAA